MATGMDIRSPVQSSGRKTVQPRRDPADTVQLLDRHAVQAQVFRARMKFYLDQGQPFIVGDYYHARAIVIPLEKHWRSNTEQIEEEALGKFKEAVQLISKR